MAGGWGSLGAKKPPESGGADSVKSRGLRELRAKKIPAEAGTVRDAVLHGLEQDVYFSLTLFEGRD